VAALQRGFISLGVFFLFNAPARANLVGPPRQTAEKTWQIMPYYQGVQKQDLNFALAGDGICWTKNNVAPNTSFACGGTGNVAGEGNGGAAMLRLVYQPYESVQYYAGFGSGDYTLMVDSVTHANTLTGERLGQLYQLGVKAVLWPDTIVAPGLAVDMSFGWQRYWFNEVHPEPVTGFAIDQRLDILQTQVAIETGHLFKPEGWRVGVEPYGGVKWMRRQAWLKDYQAGGRVGGIKDTVTPFLGVHLQVYEKEGLFAEASFVDGWQYGAGLSLRFK